MKAKYITLILLINSSIVYPQIQNKVYYGFTSDSSLNYHLLEIIDESTIELKSFARHMLQPFKLSFSYKAENEKIRLYRNHSAEDSLTLIQLGYKQFLKPITLNLDNKALIDIENKSVYVIYDDFSNEMFNYCLIDEKEYKVRTRFNKSKGIFKRMSIKNRKLKRKIRSIEKELDKYQINIYKGWEAYDKFGYKYVFGVYEIKRVK